MTQQTELFTRHKDDPAACPGLDSALWNEVKLLCETNTPASADPPATASYCCLIFFPLPLCILIFLHPQHVRVLAFVFMCPPSQECGLDLSDLLLITNMSKGIRSWGKTDFRLAYPLLIIPRKASSHGVHCPRELGDLIITARAHQESNPANSCAGVA